MNLSLRRRSARRQSRYRYRAGTLATARVVAACAAILFPALTLAPASAALAAETLELSLEQAVARATAADPGLERVRAEAAAAERVPPQAGSMPDPRLRLNAMNLPVDSFELDRVNMTQLQVGIAQRFPFPGKRRLRREAAEAAAGAAKESVTETRVQLVARVSHHWWELVYLQKALAVVERNRELLEDSAQAAAGAYEAGRGLQQDVLLAEVELSRLDERSIELQGRRQASAERLRAMLGAGYGRDLRAVGVSGQLPAALPSEAELLERARRARPRLEALRARVEQARARRELAERSAYPDFTLSANYGFRQGRDLADRQRSDFFSVMLSFDVPIHFGSKQGQAIAERRSRLTAAEHALADAVRQVRSGIGAARSDFRRWRERHQVLRERTLPQARQSVQSMRAGYRADKVDFLNLARAQVSLYEFEQQRWRALTRARQALARLEALVGVEVGGDE